MQPGLGTIMGVVGGAIWGLVWMIVISVTFMLVTGAITAPPIGAAMLAGAVCGGLIMAFQTATRTPGLTIAALGSIAIVLGLFTFGAPLGLPLGTASFAQFVAVIIFVGLTWFAIHECIV